MKRMIFHSPLPLDPNGHSGSHLRLVQMLKAFKELGYEVHEITGYGAERAKSLNALKANLFKGMKYDFLYSELSTMPMFLTEKHHLPVYFWVEFLLFSICRKKNVPLTFYYRDIHWKFNFFQRGTTNIKKFIAFAFYFLELITLRFFYSILYLPSIEMKKEVPFFKNASDVFELPPGVQKISDTTFKDIINKGKLNLLYVGGVIPPIYDISLLLRVVNTCKHAHLNLVCRKEEICNLPDFVFKSERITIFHSFGVGLQSIYEKSDLAVVALGDHHYHNFSMPVKMFEAIGFGKPILVSRSMKAASRFVSKNEIGFVVGDENDFKETINKIVSHPDLLIKKANKLSQMQNDVTWTKRAHQVSKDVEKGKHNSQAQFPED